MSGGGVEFVGVGALCTGHVCRSLSMGILVRWFVRTGQGESSCAAKERGVITHRYTRDD